MSWLLPCCWSAPPLTMGWRLGEGWLSGRGASCSPSLLLSSPLPEALPESEELLLPLLLICSITSTSARSSATNRSRAQGVCIPHQSLPPSFTLKTHHKMYSVFHVWTFLPLFMSSSWGSGEGLSLEGDGEVLTPVPGLVGARNWEVGWLDRTDCCSIRAWILLLPSALNHTHTKPIYHLLVLLDPQQLFLIHLNPNCRMKWLLWCSNNQHPKDGAKDVRSQLRSINRLNWLLHFHHSALIHHHNHISRLLWISHLVFLTWMLLLSFSSTNSPVSWLMMSTQSFWYGRLFPLNTVIGGVEPWKDNSNLNIYCLILLYFIAPTETFNFNFKWLKRFDTSLICAHHFSLFFYLIVYFYSTQLKVQSCICHTKTLTAKQKHVNVILLSTARGEKSQVFIL